MSDASTFLTGFFASLVAGGGYALLAAGILSRRDRLLAVTGALLLIVSELMKTRIA